MDQPKPLAPNDQKKRMAAAFCALEKFKAEKQALAPTLNPATPNDPEERQASLRRMTDKLTAERKKRQEQEAKKK